MTEYEIGRCTSMALTEVRTVLKRAESALEAIPREGSRYYDELVIQGDVYDIYGKDPDRQAISPHPERDEMIAALEQCVRLLERWRRTGRPLRGQR
jgi:hypothetical protein